MSNVSEDMKKLFTAVILIMLAFAHSASWAKLSKSKTREAINFLIETDRFQGTHECSGGVGVLTYEACAFKIVSDHPSATNIFHRIYKEAEVPGKIYALIGLYYDDPDFFKEELPKLLEQYKTMRLPPEGMTVGEILISDSPKAVRLSDDFPSIDSWLDAQKSSSRSFFVDVYGGSYSELFFGVEVSATQDFSLELARRKRIANQRVDLTVKTPVESGSVQGTADQP